MLINFIVWILIGGIIGWLASSLMGARGGLLMNVVVGILGAFLAGLVLTPFFGIRTIDQGNFSLPGMLMSLLGAILLLGLVNILRRLALR